jgi:putative transcriptional regulator
MKRGSVTKGTVLLAQPFMEDSNFGRAAVLITDHHETEGTVGFILNKRLNTKINTLIDDFPEIDAEVYVGGPVAHDTLHYIHDRGDILDNSIPVIDGVYWGGDYEKLKFLIESKLIESHNVKFFLGYSGWSAGQLDDELEYGSWMITQMDANYAFKKRSGELWKMITRNKGGHYTVIAEMPKSNLLN